MKEFLKNILPNSLKSFIRKSSANSWSGNFSSWEEALKKSSGYNQEQILEKVKNATLKVKTGEAVAERDSVILNEIEYSWPLVAAIMTAAALNGNGKLKVLDFGGSLGTSYFQNKHFLDLLNDVNWAIVEQESYISVGREFIQDNRLRFCSTIEESIRQNGSPDITLISSCLPYLKNPYEVLQKLIESQSEFFVIDNTYFNLHPADRLTVQQVPKQIYEASYPAWFLDYDKIKSILETHYHIISEHQHDNFLFLEGKKIYYRGLIAKLKKTVATDKLNTLP